MSLQERHVSLSSVLTRPNDTTAYAQNDLIASSTTAGSVVVPKFTIPDGDHVKAIEINRGRLITNLTTGFTTFAGHIDLWSVAPTFTNGDNGAWAVTTGAANWLGHATTDVAGTYGQYGDGASIAVSVGASFSQANNPFLFERAPGDFLYWSLRETDATGFTPIANQTFTLILDVILHVI